MRVWARYSWRCTRRATAARPNEDCRYKYYVWAFRNGTVWAAGSPFSDSNRFVQTAYGSTVRNEEGVYVVRVQVTDANDEVAYGDSLPIHVGAGGGGAGGGEIVVIRNDGGTYQTNYDALIADLTTLGAAFGEVDYSDTIATDFNDAGSLVAIWYRGGPGGGGEPQPYNPQWTQAEVDNYIQLMTDGHQVLLMSQSHGIDPVGTVWGWWYPGGRGWGPVYGWTEVDPSLPASLVAHPWAAGISARPGRGLWHGLLLPAGADELHRRD